MASIKKFFEKKRQDAKFKKLGQGHRLTDDGGPAPAGPASSPQRAAGGTPRPPPDVPHQTETQRAAALAAVARYDRQNQKNNPQWSKTYIKAEAKKLVSKESAEVPGPSASHTGPVEVECPGALATRGVFFKCPLIGPEVLPKEEMIARIRSFLYEQYEEEPALTSVLIIFSLNGSASKIEVCVATLRKYLENITFNPTEPKYRKIRKSNRAFQERVAPIEGAEKFLEAAGFESRKEDEEEFLVLPENKDVAELELLIDALSSAEPIKPELDRGIRVLQPSRAAETMNLPSDFFVLTAEELRMEQKQREEAVAKLTQLRTKSMRERDEILENRQYKYALIRVRFPDGVILQGTFGVYEKVAAVLEFVRENLTDPSAGFKLSAPGGGVSFEYPASEIVGKKTLAEAKLVPATVLNFLWTDIGNESVAGGNALRKDVLALLEDY